MQFQQYRPQRFQILPPVVKNLLIINALVYLFTVLSDSGGEFDVTKWLGLHYFSSELFRPHQLVTYMFMHGGFAHLFLNMFALWMFGNTLENVWGGKRFLIFYMFTGIGAALVQMTVNYISLQDLYSQISVDWIKEIREQGGYLLLEQKNYTNPIAAKINIIMNAPTVGASGSVFGVLLAFGMLFPNTVLYIYGLLPIKAKYFVFLYGLMELGLGIANNPADNVAHFAHLGGMLFGYIMIKVWSKNRNQFF